MPEPAPHTDFLRAFTPGTVFRDSKGREFPVRQLDAGELVLPIGRVVACDPGYLQNDGTDRQPPYTRTVPPGRYPVVLCLSRHTYPQHTEERVAAAMVRFTDAEPVGWEMALRPGQDPATLRPGHFFGYGVDGGTGCFADARAVEALEPERQQFAERVRRPWPEVTSVADIFDIWTPFFRKLHEGFFDPANPGRMAWFVDLAADPNTGANLIAFPSGWGDGAYASYWGLDAAGTPCRLATDFGILLESFQETLRLPLGGRRRRFRPPELAARGVTAIRVVEEVQDPPPPQMPGDRPFDYKLTLRVVTEGWGYLDMPVIRAGGKDYHPRMTGGSQHWFYLDQAVPADAELVVTYTARTVPL